MEGNMVGSEKKNIKGETTFRWLPGGFFLEQHMQRNFMGMEIASLELIDYDGTFSGGWRPNPGADETVNMPYDFGGHRLA
jgi:hypothetical protein